MKNRISLMASAVLIFVGSADARLTRFVIEQRTETQGFQTLSGHFFGEVDPKDPHNRIITDLQFAPRNARGMVEYSATFALTKPIDMSKSSGVLFYSVPNRGNGGPSGAEEGHISLV